MKRILAISMLLILLFGLCGCVDTTEYELTGEELFKLPEQATSYTLRHAGQTKFYLNYVQGSRCAAYQSALRNLLLNRTNKEGSMDANLYEVVTDYIIRHSDTEVETVEVKLIVNGNMVRYNGEWYEADTSQLLRQLERDFS